MDINELNLSDEMKSKLDSKLNDVNKKEGYRMYRASTYVSQSFLKDMYVFMDKMGFHNESQFVKACITKMIRQK